MCNPSPSYYGHPLKAMKTNSQNDMDDYFTQSIIGKELELDGSSKKNDQVAHVTPTSHSTESSLAKARSADFHSTPQITRTEGDRNEISTQDFLAAELSQLEPQATDKKPEVSPADSRSSLESFLRQEPTLDSAVSSPSLHADSKIVKAQASPTAKTGSTNSTRNFDAAVTDSQVLPSAKPITGHDWIMHNAGQGGPRQVKISTASKEQTHFLKKSIRMDTLIFGLLGLIVSLVLIFTAYTLWLQ